MCLSLLSDSNMLISIKVDNMQDYKSLQAPASHLQPTHFTEQFIELSIEINVDNLITATLRPDWWSAAEMVVLLEGSPVSTEEIWSFVRVNIGFLFTSLTKALLPRFLSLAGRPALERVLVVPNFFHLRMMEPLKLCSWGTSMLQTFLVPFHRSVPRHNPVSELYGQFL